MGRDETPQLLADWFDAHRRNNPGKIAGIASTLAQVDDAEAETILQAVRREVAKAGSFMQKVAIVSGLFTVMGVAASFFWAPLRYLKDFGVLIMPATVLAAYLGIRHNPVDRKRLALRALGHVNSPKVIGPFVDALNEEPKRARGLRPALARALRRLRPDDADVLDTPTLQKLMSTVHKTRRLRERDEAGLELNLAICDVLGRLGYAWIPFDNIQFVAEMRPINRAQERLRDAAAECVEAIAERRESEGLPAAARER